MKSEAQILDFGENHLENAAAKAVLLLAVLYGKRRGTFRTPAVKAVAQTTGQEVWAKPILVKLDFWLDRDLSWEAALADLIEDFILNQHTALGCFLKFRVGKIQCGFAVAVLGNF